MSYAIIEKALLGLTLLVGAFSIFMGLGAIAGGGEGPHDLGYTLFGLAALAVGTMLLGGVYSKRGSPGRLKKHSSPIDHVT